MVLQKVWNPFKSSFWRRQESSYFSMFWVTGQIRYDEFELFTNSLNFYRFTPLV